MTHFLLKSWLLLSPPPSHAILWWVDHETNPFLGQSPHALPVSLNALTDTPKDALYQSPRHFSFQSSWQSRLIITLVGDLRPHEWQNQGSNADLADGQDAGFFTMLLGQAHVGQRLEEAIARSKNELVVILCCVMNPGFRESSAEHRSLTTFSVTCWCFFSWARLCTLWEKITCFIYICFDITTVSATSNYWVLQRWCLV